MRKFFASIFFATQLLATGADLVIFSYDRPLQLYALLESAEQHVDGIEQVVVLYRTSNEAYQDGYEKVAVNFPYVKFIQQSDKNAKTDFKPLLMHALRKICHSSYVLFAVDDIVVKDHIDLPMCISFLQKYQAEGFHLRLGTHLDYCYNHGKKQPLPAFKKLEGGVLLWRFNQGKDDWRYPHSVDCTVYRKKQILKEFAAIKFRNPNTLEAKWAAKANLDLFGLCFTTSKVVNLPFNLVNEVYQNAAMHSISPEEFLKLFNLGKKMDIAQLFQINNRSVHIEYEPTFINRGS